MLPNITGTFRTSCAAGHWFGAFYYVGRQSVDQDDGGSSGFITGFDASKCSPIYKNDWNEVTPTNTTIKIWKRVS